MAVTIHYADGFDKYDDSAHLNDYYGRTDANYDFEISSDTPFGEGQSLKYPDTNAVGSTYNSTFYLPDQTAFGRNIADNELSPLFFCFRFKLGPTAQADTNFQLIADCESGNIFNQYISGNAVDGSLSLYGDSSAVNVVDSASGLSYADGNWHSAEFYWTYSGTNSEVNGYFYLDGELILSGSNYDGKYSSYGSPVVIPLFVSIEDWFIDDLVTGTCTAPATDRLGAGGIWQVPLLTIDADAGTNQWTPSAGSDHYAMIDEADADDDTTYLESSAGSQAEEFSLATFAASVDKVLAFSVTGVFRSSTVGISRATEIYIKSVAAEDVLAGPFTITGTTYGERRSEFVSIDPNTAAAWTKAGAQACKIGFRV